MIVPFTLDLQNSVYVPVKTLKRLYSITNSSCYTCDM